MINKLLGAIKEPLKRIGQVGLKVGRFALQNHQYIAPLLHGVSMASGNETAQKITGGLLSLSNMASMRKNLNQSNARVADTMKRTGATSGIFDHYSGAKVG